ncbi:hypothetical protein FRC01_007687 [Tulasnella sp. 417]|nr:hypothetical protein FRC01_007687 [Tulasnella sp. 417]
MDTLSLPAGRAHQAFINQLRRDARENIPPSVHDLILHQIVIVQYERGVRLKKERDVPSDLARVLPGIEPLVYIWKLSEPPSRSSRFAVFLSDFDEIPLAILLRGHHKTLLNSLLATSGSIRYLTNFACRPVKVEEKMPVADLVTGYIQPFEGATLVLERDREDIRAYEAEYEESVRLYRLRQSKLAVRPPNQGDNGADPAVAEDSTNEEARRVERDEKSQVNDKEEGGSSIRPKRRSRAAEEEDQATHCTAGPLSASTSMPKPSRKKRQRKNNAALDPITSDDRDQWIDYVVESKEDGNTHYDLLKDFLSTIGWDRNWAVQQWNAYLKDNTTYVTRQIDQLKRSPK